MKVIVYAISKNEEKFAERWSKSMSEADEIYVLDTGSTDSTVNILKQNNVHVTSEVITPWRFDIARNKSLELVPLDADICVCTDLDEIFTPGWRKTLETLWNPNTTRLSYNYNWSLDKLNKPLINFYIQKIHIRKNYKWTHPVHEILEYTGANNEILQTTDEITLNHYPDNKKNRNNYLSLLELSIKESPEDDRNMHYLGREYMYHKMWNKSIDTLIKHLNLPSSTWLDERSASMRYISRCYIALNRPLEAKMWLTNAINETPYLRDPLVELALLYYNEQDYKNVIKYCKEALKIQEHEKTYINEPFSWDNTIYDLLSISYYYTNNIEESINNLQKALSYDPTNERLLNNLSIIKKEEI